jgi:transposase
VKFQYTTKPEHMPAAHRAHADWSPSRLIAWAEKVGPATARLVAEILESRPHPEQGYRACLGVMRLRERYPDERIERACLRALTLRAVSYRSVQAILKNNRDREGIPPSPAQQPLPLHGNVRGPGYYH